ncbi:MAG: DUF4832 domain-containing protein [Xanthomonadales bacterium]|nr:DUF4832 domain-containing protein [Xanthomonadales bacterium]
MTLRTLGFWLIGLLGWSSAEAVTILYTASDADIPNPERGLFEQTFAYATEQAPGQAYQPLSGDSNFIGMRGRNRTVAWRLVSLLDFRDSDTLPAGLIDALTTDFNTARTNGVKLYLRFAYSFNGSGSFTEVPIDRTLLHIQQLGALLSTHADVITHLDAGMLGRYGEWYSPTGEITPAMRSAVVAAWLAALPTDRAITLRAPAYKQAQFGSTALSEGFDGSDAARVGHHNDCYLKSLSDLGTYSGEPTARAAEKAYVAAETRFVPMSGETCGRYAIEPSFETCGAGEDCSNRSDCPTALAESAAHHWSLLNARYHPALVDDPGGDWAVQGCLNDFRRRLGYRLQLVSATLPDSAAVGGNCAWNTRVVMRNVGFAAPFNSRGWSLVFESVSTGALTTLDLRTVTQPRSDPRHWLPELDSFELSLGARPPAGLAPGQYRLLLALPDGRTSLAPDPDYAIQLANIGLWDGARGLNRLNHTVTLTSCSGSYPVLSAGTVTTTAGATVPLSVSFDDGGIGLAGVQFDLSYDPQLGQPNLAQASASNGVAPTCALPASAPGQIRCVAFPAIGNLPPSFSFLLPFTVDAGASPGSGFALALSRHEFVDDLGELVAGGLVDGSLNVLAEPAPPQLTAVPVPGSTIDFGNLVPGQTRSASIELVNSAAAGSSDLLLSQCSISGSATFSLTGSPAFPVNLAPAQSLSLNVVFAPTAVGTQMATLSCTHNAAGSPASFALTGMGVGDALLSDGFETP